MTLELGSEQRVGELLRETGDNAKSSGVFTGIVTGAVVAIATAAFGYFFGVVNDIRKSKLDFVNAQIEKLYGPLYAETQANNATWDEFKKQPYWRKNPQTVYFFSDADPPTVEEAKRWRTWIKAVFQPLNIEMEKAIIENSQLVIGENIPRAFNKIVAQTEAYKAVMSGWKDDDFDKCMGKTVALCSPLSYASNTAPLNYPEEIIPCVEQDYQTLKQRQALLEQSFFVVLYDSTPQRSKECDTP